MLKHEDNPAPTPLTAAEARATPEELAAAITRLQARKDASQRQREGTVPIGEVVEQLGIDATPEEILAELQAGQAEESKKQKRRLSVKQLFSQWLVAAMILIGIPVYWNYYRKAASPVPNVTAAPAIVLSPPTNSNQASSIHLDPHLLVLDASGKLVMLSEVADNQPVQCRYQYGSFRLYLSNDIAFWTMIKHEGKTYVRGWMPRMSKQVLEADGADICLYKYKSGGFVVPVTLLVSGFKVSSDIPDGIPSADVGTGFHAQDIHFDNHTYEKWQP